VGSRPTAPALSARGRTRVDGWIDVCEAAVLTRNDVLRFDHDHHTYAIYRTEHDTVHATDGMCTHGNTHLADGLVKGTIVECPKHNGRFDITTGEPRRLPVCVALRTHEVQVVDGRILLKLPRQMPESTYSFNVVSNRNVATFIKELVLAPADGSAWPAYRPGQYLQLRIPVYDSIGFRDFDVDEPYASVWRAHGLFDVTASNPLELRRNYSLATNPASADRVLRFNVRIATPPHGQACAAGVGSSFVWALKPGDTVTAGGPFGTFLIRDTNREMVYLGGGAGMAPIRSHLSHLLETLQTGRRVTFWYGARSRQEVFYDDYFRSLEAQFSNFRFHVALSTPLPDDGWTGHTGFVHDVLRREHLERHPAPTSIEYYLCGPPVMVQAARDMLVHEFGVAAACIAYDEY